MKLRFCIFLCLLNLFTIQIFAQSSNTLFSLLSSEESGVDFKNQLKESEKLNVLAYEYFYNGGGVAIGDINNDGLEDIYFSGNMVQDKLYLNLGNMKFKDITRQAKLNTRNKWKTGVTMVDINADGLLDIYLCYSGNTDEDNRRNQLFVNNGDLTFSEKAEEYGIDDPSYSTQAAFLDYDLDGDPDMYLLNHNINDYKDVELEYLKTTYDSLAGDRLYQNQNGKFVDVSKEAGISGNPISFGLGVSVADVNNDRFPDIYVSNDYRENDYLYINNGDGTFTDKIHESFGHISEFSMGNDVADINNDGLLDIITLDMLPEDNRRQKLLQGPENYELYQSAFTNGFHYQSMRNMLQLNNGDGTFSEIGQLSGISNTDWSWSPLIADFDNDGNKDLFITNGYLRDYTNKDFLKYWGDYLVEKAVKMEETKLLDLIKSMPSTLTNNYAFHNNGNLTFKNTTQKWGIDQLALSHGAAYGDLDNDGDLDLVVNNVNSEAFVYKNNASLESGNSYLDLQLAADKNKCTIGARVTAYLAGAMQILEQSISRGFQSSVSPRLHFGLGNKQIVDSLIVRWPDGDEDKLYAIPANQKITIKKGVNSSQPREINSISDPLFKSFATTLTFNHSGTEINDFKRQPLMPFMHSHLGPAISHGDVNNDGLQDVFIGAGRGQASVLYLQSADGSFSSANSFTFERDKDFSVSDAEFADVNSDGHPDLIIVNGGYHELEEGNPQLLDRLYINDGIGNMIRKKNFIKLPTSKSCVSPADFDNDGDIDLFIGGRVVPGAYPSTPKSYLLSNDGKGNFSDISEMVFPETSALGMVTDAKWADLDKNGYKDLIVVGEWMPVTFFLNDGRKLINRTNDFIKEPYSGLWNTLLMEDLDEDGDVDLVVGNIGTNTQLAASQTEPLTMTFKDFDGNGSIDPFLCTYIQGVQYPYVTRDELLDQIYSMRKKYTNYKSFADARLEDIFLPEELKDAESLQVNSLETTFFENQGARFTKRELPVQSQFSSVNSIISYDVNGDFKKDLLLFGNNEYLRLRIGKVDANYGTLLINRGNGEFEYVPQTDSGLSVKGDVKCSTILKTAYGALLLLGINENPLQTYIIKRNSYEN